MALDISKGFDILKRGVIGTLSPHVLKGLLNEALDSPLDINGVKTTIDNKLITKLVQSNVNLWFLLDDEMKEQVRKGIDMIGDIDWITADWIVESVAKQHPKLASLFLSWDDAMIWLDKQIQVIKDNYVMEFEPAEHELENEEVVQRTPVNQEKKTPIKFINNEKDDIKAPQLATQAVSEGRPPLPRFSGLI